MSLHNKNSSSNLDKSTVKKEKINKSYVDECSQCVQTEESKKDQILSLPNICDISYLKDENRNIKKFTISKTKGERNMSPKLRMIQLNTEDIIKEESPKIKEDKKFKRIFRQKFYADIDNNVRREMNKKEEISDKLLKERFIYMKKVVGFWGALGSYAAQNFAYERYKYACLNDSLKEKKKKKLPCLYTNSFIINQRKKENKTNKLYLSDFIKIYA
ncbi:MAG: hypothetical protein MJ252_17830 [archaeon]|nr:hypothetical protein [archaeon]